MGTGRLSRIPGQRTIQILPPLQGINNDFARIEQPPKTTVDCSNVFPYGSEFRSRIAARPGVAASSLVTGGTIVGSTGNISVLQQVSYVSGGAVVSKMYGVRSSIAAGAGKGKLYYIDGGALKQVTPATNTVATVSATTGTAIPTTYAGAFVHRNRLYLIGPDHLFAASKVDDYGNFDTADRTSARSFTSQTVITSSPGSMMDPIITGFPWTNDLAVLAGDHSLWALRGDLAMGGRVDILSSGVGILGPSAWTIDPLNNCWIIGTGGIYKGTGGQFTPINVGHYSAYFQSLNRSTNIPSCVWDRDRFGLWIFAKGKDALFYNARDGGFWPCPLNTNVTACGVFDGPAPADRQILYADTTPTVFTIDSTAVLDPGGAAVSAYIFLGPIIPFGNSNSVLTETIVTLGNASQTVTWTLQAGNSPYQAYSGGGQSSATGTFSAATNRQARLRTRLRGSCFYLKLSSTTGFEFEDATMSFSPAGRVHA